MTHFLTPFLTLFPNIETDTILTVTGSLPPGITMHAIDKFIETARQKGEKIVVDSRSFTKADLLRVRPWLIKPNEEEISEYLGKTVESFADIIDGAKEFFASGIENVLVSLGGKGALLCCSSGIFAATPPDIAAVSTIGAGDSTVAGFIAGELAGLSPVEKLRQAVAFGSAACLTPGSNPPLAADAKRLLSSVSIARI